MFPWEILWAVLILLGVGALLGLGLAIATVVLHVKEDERIEEVAKRLPNYNCGSCGYAGCKGLAEAIVKGEENNLRKCKPGKEASFSGFFNSFADFLLF